jgi:proton-dependent oligopeptide transporter, POT family
VYLHEYVNKDIDVELVLVTDSILVITCTILVNYLLRKVAAFSAIVLGTLVSSLCWLVLVWRPSMWGAVGAIAVLAIGEMIQQPRYYEYISRLAPPGQQGTYMGFAFLPLGIGSLIGGWFGGKMLHYFGEQMGKPEYAWYTIVIVGLVTTMLLWIYDRIVRPVEKTG